MKKTNTSRDHPGRKAAGMEPGSGPRSKTARTGLESGPGNDTGSNLGKKLNTESRAKASAGAKLRSETAAQKAAGEKMRFDKAVFEPEPEGASPVQRKMKRYGKKQPSPGQAAKQLSSGKFHQEISRENADDNVGVEAANTGSQAAETASDLAADKAGDTASNALSRWRQKQAIKKEYTAAKTGKTAGEYARTAAGGGQAAGNAAGAAGGASAKGAGKAAKEGKNVLEAAVEFIRSHSHMILVIGGLFLMVVILSGVMSSCAVFFQSASNMVVSTSFTADDNQITGVEGDYVSMETALQNRIDNIEDEYPGYDEYNITQDQVGHDPYELAAYLTVLYHNYTRDQVKEKLRELFDSQYTLTITETVVEGDDEDDDDYYILNVNLKNKGLTEVIGNAGMTEDEQSHYAALMQNYGNKKEIFGDNPYAVAVEDVLHYDIPGEALTDERFRKMITEAEKYLGYPYVWGGSSPSTSFDCSGFVSWVVNHCGNGWNVGRQTAEGLRQCCKIIPKSEAKPGDLIFFKGTYKTSGASHVGIYVGNGMMIHSGKPCQYASCETQYWKEHFWCYGRLP